MHKLHGTGLEVLYGRGKENCQKIFVRMAEKEERVRVHLEDYALYNLIRKLNCTGHVRTGILLGSKMVTENKRCWFVKGAV